MRDDEETGVVSVPIIAFGISDETISSATAGRVSVSISARVIIRVANCSTPSREVFVFCANRLIFVTIVSYSSKASNIERDSAGMTVCQCSFWVASSSIPTEEPAVRLSNRIVRSVLVGDSGIPSCGGGINPTGDSDRVIDIVVDRGVKESSMFWYCALSVIDGDTIPLLFKGVVSCGGEAIAE